MSEKIENLLNLAIAADEEELSKSRELSTGYNETDDSWDLIIRYTNNLDFVANYPGTRSVRLMGNYAILTVPRRYVELIANEENIIFIEKPKPLYFAVTNGMRVSCITSVQSNMNLYGEGVIVGIIDSGIDYANSVFRNQDGTTRILELWDQSVESGTPPEGYARGSVYYSDDINRALEQSGPERYNIVPSRDLSGHGTHVAGIAAGNFASNQNNNLGIATKSPLIVVKLGNQREGSFPRTIELMEAIDYVVNRALYYQMPLSLNLSFGNTYGSHDGTSLLETYIDFVADMEQICIAVGSGNEGSAGGHTSGFILQGEMSDIELAVSNFERNLSIQIWKSFADVFDIEIFPPNSNNSVVLGEYNEATRYPLKDVTLLVYYGTPKPYSKFQEIYIDFIPKAGYVPTGIWRIRLTGRNIKEGNFDMWLPTNAALGTNTRFLRPTPDTTLTIPSTAQKVVTVGAYDAATDRIADFSGRGYTRQTRQIKPDIVAPGVNIQSAAVGGGLRVTSGTSMATPFVTGSMALMMEWGIVRGNDRFFYGEKVKAYLIRGARKLSAYTSYPNEITGYGALCLEDSMPE